MKVTAITLGLFFSLTALWSQESQISQDPAAGQVLDRVGQKIRLMRSMQADFELVIDDRKEATRNSSEGNLVVKQNKYKINSQGSLVFYDGKTMWTYQSANNEVTITEPDNQANDFMSNPANFFASYKKDFKYRYVGESNFSGVKCHEIDLFPRDLHQPYSRIKVFINVKSDLPEMISSIGKDGIDYSVHLKNLKIDQEIGDDTFAFDPSKYKKVEIVDMRGIR